MIKNWPHFRGQTPYSDWWACHTKDLKFIPVKGACKLHSDLEFDAYIAGCGCEEWKFAKRPPEEIREIEALQQQVNNESILRRAQELLKAGLPSKPRVNQGTLMRFLKQETVDAIGTMIATHDDQLGWEHLTQLIVDLVEDDLRARWSSATQAGLIVEERLER